MTSPATQDGVLISLSARTDVGMRRSGNEDSFLVADLTTGRVGLSPEVMRHRLGARGSLLVVSDGMGGAAAGEVASSMAVQILFEEMARNFVPGAGVVEALRRASEIANQRIWEKSQSDINVRGLGATLTAAFVLGGKLYVSQVGDSRAYIIRGPQVKQITEDQSWANAIKKAGIEPRDIPNNVILQALGTQPTLNAEVTGTYLCRGDFLLLCSDGLSNKVQDHEMHSLVSGAPNLEIACRNLIDLANQRGGEDNITAVVARFDGEMLPTADDLSVTDTLDVLTSADVPDTAPVAAVPQANAGNSGSLARQTALMGSLSPQAQSYFHDKVKPLPPVSSFGHQPPPAAAYPEPTPITPGSYPNASHPPSKSNHSIKLIGIGIVVFLILGAVIVFFALKMLPQKSTTGFDGGSTGGSSTNPKNEDLGNEESSKEVTEALAVVKETIQQVQETIKISKESPEKEKQDQAGKCREFEQELGKIQAELEKYIKSKNPITEQIRTDAAKHKKRANEIRREIQKMNSLPGRPGVSEGKPSSTKAHSSSGKSDGDPAEGDPADPNKVKKGLEEKIKKLPGTIPPGDKDKDDQ